MKIIEDRRTPNCRRVRIFLAEKGVTLPYEQIDIMKLDQRSEAFSALNPRQRVPVLVLDDGRVITESVAICRYFDALHPEPALLGRGAYGAAVVEMWSRRVELELFWPIAHAVRHGSPAMAPLETPQIGEWADLNKTFAMRALAFLNDELATRPFIAGDDFTIADITAFVALDFARVVRLRPPEEMTHLARWRADIAARPSASA
ncbi:MAG: glutathione S-transferase [Hyphomicrobiales bacterium]|nr:glutathione S-transferase [Hyphomicrobiales bacterium]